MTKLFFQQMTRTLISGCLSRNSNVKMDCLCHWPCFYNPSICPSNLKLWKRLCNLVNLTYSIWYSIVIYPTLRLWNVKKGCSLKITLHSHSIHLILILSNKCLFTLTLLSFFSRLISFPTTNDHCRKSFRGKNHIMCHYGIRGQISDWGQQTWKSFQSSSNIVLRLLRSSESEQCRLWLWVE